MKLKERIATFTQAPAALQESATVVKSLLTAILAVVLTTLFAVLALVVTA